MSDKRSEAAAFGADLAAELQSVTLEEFRLTEARYETDAQLGRELLFLLSNAEWSRRTTEILDVSRVSAVETRVTVDVDPGCITHEAIDGPLRLPLFTLPSEIADDGRPDAPEPPIGVAVLDAAGDRVAPVPQAEVRRQLAAVLAEMMVIRLDRMPSADADSGYGRDHDVLLAAAINQLLARPPSAVPPWSLDAPPPDRPEADLMLPGTPLEYARNELRFLVEDDDSVAREWLLTSWEADIVRALRGSTFVVVPVETAGPTSFTLTMPSRALARTRRTSSSVRLRLAVLAPTTHADRVTEILLPDGVRLTGADAARAVVDVEEPQQFHHLATLIGLVLDPELPAWPRKQLAEFAGTKLESVLQCLRHHYDAYEPGAVAPDRGLRTELRTLRTPLRRLGTGPVRDAPPGPTEAQSAVMTELARRWAPLQDRLTQIRLRRRVERSTASPGSVRFRAPAIEDFTLRAQPTGAYLEVELEAGDSPVLGTARAVNLINVVLLGLVLALFLYSPFSGVVDRTILAPLLTFFPAIQAGRLSQPDGTQLVGLLTMRHYLAGLATALPGLALAGIIAFGPQGDQLIVVAAVCLALQLGCALWIRDLRDPERWYGLPSRLRPRTRHPLTLGTLRSPDHLRFDVLRTAWCRTLTADVLLAGRSAHPYLVVDDGSRDAFARLLAGAQGEVEHHRTRDLVRLLNRTGPEPERPAPNLVGVLRGSAADAAATFLVFRDEPDETWSSSADGVLALDVRPGQLAPMEPPDWVLDVMIGFDPALCSAPVQEHPLATVAYAAELAGFTVLNVQLPALPLEDDRPRRWLRARIGVPLRRDDPLDRLALFLDRLHRMREHGLRVHLREVPPTESLDATQAAREDPFDAPPGLLDPVGSAPKKTGDLVTADEVLAAPGPDVRRLVVCAPPNAGLLAGVLSALAVSGQVASLDAAVTGILNGTAVLFLTCRALAAGETPLPEVVAEHPTLRGWPITVTVLPAPRPQPGNGDRSDALLHVRVYTADRPGVLQSLAAALGREIGREATGNPVPVDVLYSFVPVVDGRSVSGRLLVRLPAHREGNAGWEAVHWPTMERRVAKALSAGRSADTVIGLDLVRRPKWLATP